MSRASVVRRMISLRFSVALTWTVVAAFWLLSGSAIVRGVESSAGAKMTGPELEVTIPANTMANVYVPAKDAAHVTESGKPAPQAEGVRFLGAEEGTALFEAGAGHYQFSSRL